jgi:hypothetical protein
MHERCSDPRSPSFHRYGARGIAVCERWKDFEAFWEDMGERPQDHTLGRLDHNKGYEPGNCEWQTRSKQMKTRPPRKVFAQNATGGEENTKSSERD